MRQTYGGLAAPDGSGNGPYRGQRALDLTLVALSAPLTIPLVALAAIAVKLDSRGPALFHQVRVGIGGRPFRVHKLRTMPVKGADRLRLPTAENLTRTGRWLRRTSLDELPQMWNVARGEMSIVGPRPTLAYQVGRYTPRQRRRLEVRPGVTGLAQVSGRNSLSWAERIDLDITYVETASLRTDLAIIARTFKAIATPDGVEGHRADDPLVATEELT